MWQYDYSLNYSTKHLLPHPNITIHIPLFDFTEGMMSVEGNVKIGKSSPVGIPLGVEVIAQQSLVGQISIYYL